VPTVLLVQLRSISHSCHHAAPGYTRVSAPCPRGWVPDDPNPHPAHSKEHQLSSQRRPAELESRMHAGVHAKCSKPYAMKQFGEGHPTFAASPVRAWTGGSAAGVLAARYACLVAERLRATTVVSRSRHCSSTAPRSSTNSFQLTQREALSGGCFVVQATRDANTHTHDKGRRRVQEE